jgi:hypothetical protein
MESENNYNQIWGHIEHFGNIYKIQYFPNMGYISLKHVDSCPGCSHNPCLKDIIINSEQFLKIINYLLKKYRTDICKQVENVIVLKYPVKQFTSFESEYELIVHNIIFELWTKHKEGKFTGGKIKENIVKICIDEDSMQLLIPLCKGNNIVNYSALDYSCHIKSIVNYLTN